MHAGMIALKIIAKQLDFLEDDAIYAQLQQWIGFPFTFSKLYEASSLNNTVSGPAFHSACDNKGPTITIARMGTGHIIGGFTMQCWAKGATVSGSYSCGEDRLAFIFALCGANGLMKPILGRIKEANYKTAILRADNCGPTFGLPQAKDCYSYPDLSSVDLSFFNNQWKFTARSFCYSIPANTFPPDGTVVERLEVYSVELSLDGASLDFSQLEVSTGPKVKLWQKLSFNEKSRDELLAKLRSRKPKGAERLHVPAYNILLFAGVGAGKSSFVNTLDTALRGRLSSIAMVGKGSRSITSILAKRRLHSTAAINLWDTMGFTVEVEKKMEFTQMFHYLVSGNLVDNFDLSKEILVDTPGINLAPTLADRVHIVALLVPEESASDDVYMGRLCEFLKITNKPNIAKVVVLLSKVDRADPALLEDDLSKVDSSARVAERRKLIAQKVGLQPFMVIPIKNYYEEGSPDVAVDVLALDALWRMLDCADDFLVEQARIMGIKIDED